MQKFIFLPLFESFIEAMGANKVEAGLLCKKLIDKFTPAEAVTEDAAVFISKYFEKVVIPHKKAVGAAFVGIRDELRSIGIDTNQLGSLIIDHDLSKFSQDEAWGYARYNFRGLNSAQQDHDFVSAWNHHKQNNPHHPEYWLNPDKTGKCHPLPMPDIYIAEMICDWIGAGKSYGNPFEKWAIQNLPTFLFHKTTANRLVDMLEVIFPNMYFEIAGSNQVFCGERIDDIVPDHDRL